MGERALSIEDFKKMISDNNTDEILLNESIRNDPDVAYAKTALRNATERLKLMDYKGKARPVNVPQERKDAYRAAQDLIKSAEPFVPARFGKDDKLDAEFVRKVNAVHAAIQKMPMNPQGEKAVRDMILALYRSPEGEKLIDPQHPDVLFLWVKYRSKKGQNVINYAHSNERTPERDAELISFFESEYAKDYDPMQVQTILTLLKAVDPSSEQQ